MLNTAILVGQKHLDSLVSRIGRRLPGRTVGGTTARDRDLAKLRRTLSEIRETFATHDPPIIVGRHLGSGGFSDVFLAESDYDGETKFVVKILRSDLLRIRRGPGIDRREEEMRVKEVKRRFSNEAYIQWHLSKSLSERVARSVVKVYDHGEFDSEKEFRFILMERMGSALRDFLSNPANCTEDPDLLLYKAVLMTKIAEVIRNVHLEGVFHRDIKPENILFPLVPVGDETKATDTPAKSCARHIQLKLADFGTVRWVRTHSDRFDSEIIGSQYYMSPEQIFHPQRLDPRTDIYSLGLVCYELLHGKHAKGIDRGTPVALEKAARRKAIRLKPPAGYEPLDEIIMHCLEGLGTRYQTMDAVVIELRAFTADLWRRSGEALPFAVE